MLNFPKQFPTLETERLLLRRTTKKDASPLFRCYSDPGIMKYLGTPLDNEDSIGGVLDEYINGYEEGYNLIWVLEVKENGSFAGTAGYESFSFLDNKADIGFTLLQSHQRMGYMSEALKAIITFGMNVLLLKRIQATVVKENKPSIDLFTKLGFCNEGLMSQSVFFCDRYHDELIYAKVNKGK